jgi:hypothetical protein
MARRTFLIASLLLAGLTVAYDILASAVQAEPHSAQSLDLYAYGLAPLIVLVLTTLALAMAFRNVHPDLRGTARFAAVSWLLIGVANAIMAWRRPMGVFWIEVTADLAAGLASSIAVAAIAFLVGRCDRAGATS